MKSSPDIYASITGKIISALESGTRPWEKPWHAGSATLPLRSNGIPYQGINTLILWLTADEEGYQSPSWMTYKQAQALGGQVNKGQKGTRIVYTSTFSKSDTDQDGQEVEQKVRFLKTYTVFNADQIEGLPESFYAPVFEALDLGARIAHCENFFAKTGATLHHGGGRAYFSPSEDYIQMPDFVSFRSPEAYYSVLAHETIHWSGHPSRLDRNLTSFRADPEQYAFEELVAELGASFLCARLQLEPEPREDHASYIAHWLKILKDNDRAVFRAASLAQRAVEYVVAFIWGSAENDSKTLH